MKSIIKLIRVNQWVKNLFLFVPAFFAGNLFNTDHDILLGLGFFCFSFVASGIYIINDSRDIEADKLHPKKKFRPLASGAVSVNFALSLSGLLVLTGLVGAYLIHVNFLILLGVYFVMNLAYSYGLKNVPILDLFIVAFGFLLRIYSGGIIGGIPISQWLFIMILLLSLFLILAKRKDDLEIKDKTGQTMRKASAHYNIEFVNSCLTLFAAVIIVAYIMYTVSDEVVHQFNSSYLYLTTIFVLAGIIRYLQITFVEKDSGSPTSVLYKDKFIIITILLWVASFYLIIYAF